MAKRTGASQSSTQRGKTGGDARGGRAKAGAGARAKSKYGSGAGAGAGAGAGGGRGGSGGKASDNTSIGSINIQS